MQTNTPQISESVDNTEKKEITEINQQQRDKLTADISQLEDFDSLVGELDFTDGITESECFMILSEVNKMIDNGISDNLINDGIKNIPISDVLTQMRDKVDYYNDKYTGLLDGLNGATYITPELLENLNEYEKQKINDIFISRDTFAQYLPKIDLDTNKLKPETDLDYLINQINGSLATVNDSYKKIDQLENFFMDNK